MDGRHTSKSIFGSFWRIWGPLTTSQSMICPSHSLGWRAAVSAPSGHWLCMRQRELGYTSSRGLPISRAASAGRLHVGETQVQVPTQCGHGHGKLLLRLGQSAPPQPSACRRCKFRPSNGMREWLPGVILLRHGSVSPGAPQPLGPMSTSKLTRRFGSASPVLERTGLFGRYRTSEDL